jgi:methionyl-tRNA formyltransferase
VERAILAGDTETGVCLMKVEAGLDTGPVYACTTVPIGDLDLDALRHRLVDAGSALLVDSLADGPAGLPVPQPQEGEPTNADKVTTEDLHLHWEEPAEQLWRVVRLGRAWTTFRGQRLRVVGASVDEGDELDEGSGPVGTLVGTVVRTGQGGLRLERVQPESRAPMAASDWLRGVRPAVGERLGTE